MSAPAAASAVGHGQADTAPGTGHDGGPSGEVEQRGHLGRPPASRAEPSCTPPPSRRAAKAASDLLDRNDPGDQLLGRDRTVVDQPDRLGHVVALVEAGTEQFQLAPEEPVQVRPVRGCGWMATMTSRPRVVSTSTAVSTPLAAPDTSKATSAPAPAVRSSPARRRRSLPGRRRRARAARPPLGGTGSGSTSSTRPPRSRATHRDEHADRAAADHDDLFAGGDPRPPDVVDGDRGRLDERRVVQRQRVGKRDHELGRDGPDRLHGAGRVDAEEVQGVADVRVPSPAGGAAPARARRHHRDRLGRRTSRSTPAPTAATRPDISWPITAAAPTRASMSPW